jgi:hypothetical protein
MLLLAAPRCLAILPLFAVACGGNVAVDAPPTGQGSTTGGGGGAGTTIGVGAATAAGGDGAGGCFDTEGDPHHCGACGHDCQGGACEGGQCQPVVIACEQAAHAVALDGAHVYWLNEPGPVMRAPKAGGPPEELTGSQNQAGWGLAVDSTRVYWPTYQGIQAAPKGGGAAATVLPGDSYDVALDDGNVYTTYPGIRKAPKEGGPVEWLADGPSIGLTVSGGYVYWTTWELELVQKVPVDGGPVVTIASGEPYPQHIAVLGEFAYFTTAYGRLLRASTDGGAVTVLAESLGAYGVAVDQTGIYLTTFDQGSIRRIPIDGGEPQILAGGQFFPRDIALDETSVYWTNDDGIGEGQGCVMKVAKPPAP